MLNSPASQPLQTYVTFNFRANVDHASKKKLDTLNSSWAPSLPHSYVASPYLKQEYHVTFGESIYCERNKEGQIGRTRVKQVNVKDAKVVASARADGQKMLRNIKQKLITAQTGALTGYEITGFRVSDRGFIFATMQSDANANKISRSFKNASMQTASTNSDVRIGLKEFYLPTDPFTMHVSIGRLQLPAQTKLAPEEKARYQAKLDNDPLLNAYKHQVINFEGKAILSASYLDKQERKTIAHSSFPLAPERDLAEDMARLTLQDKPKPVLRQFPAQQARPLPVLRQIVQQQKQPVPIKSNTKPTIDDIKKAIQVFFPERVSTDIQKEVLVKLSDKSKSGMIEIGFHCAEEDRKRFCEKFKQHFPGARGLCKYSDVSKKYVVMDEAAVKTLLNFVEQHIAAKRAILRKCC